MSVYIKREEKSREPAIFKKKKRDRNVPIEAREILYKFVPKKPFHFHALLFYYFLSSHHFYVYFLPI